MPTVRTPGQVQGILDWNMMDGYVIGLATETGDLGVTRLIERKEFDTAPEALRALADLIAAYQAS